jgi:hypothetical protein
MLPPERLQVQPVGRNPTRSGASGDPRAAGELSAGLIARSRAALGGLRLST